MSALQRFGKVFRKGGIQRAISVLRSQYGWPIPVSAKFRHQGGVQAETEFWDEYFRTKGLWYSGYGAMLDPDSPLQPRPAALLPPRDEVHILDVGAGPLTYLGKTHAGKRINITAVDPLADEYDRILAKYRVVPVVRTQKLSAEDLTKRFPSNAFDLVTARNCIDHSLDPERAILQMIEVAKSDASVLLEHRPNEADRENYAGFHQWNFSLSASGHFLISSKSTQVNMTEKYSALCSIECEIVASEDEDWLITTIQKR